MEQLYEQEKSWRIAAEQRAKTAEAKLERVAKILHGLLGSLNAIQAAGKEIQSKMDEATKLSPG